MKIHVELFTNLKIGYSIKHKSFIFYIDLMFDTLKNDYCYPNNLTKKRRHSIKKDMNQMNKLYLGIGSYEGEI